MVTSVSKNTVGEYNKWRRTERLDDIALRRTILRSERILRNGSFHMRHYFVEALPCLRPAAHQRKSAPLVLDINSFQLPCELWTWKPFAFLDRQCIMYVYIFLLIMQCHMLHAMLLLDMNLLWLCQANFLHTITDTAMPSLARCIFSYQLCHVVSYM